jgi:PhnB protein
MEGPPAHGLIAQIFVEASERYLSERCAGATPVMPMTDMFFGIREGRVSDPIGNVWIIATPKERLSPEEIQRRLRAEGY